MATKQPTPPKKVDKASCKGQASCKTPPAKGGGKMAPPFPKKK